MEKSLAVTEQKTVEFYGDELTAVRIDTDIFVSVRHLCDALGLDRASQARRMRRDEILADGYKGGVMVTSPGGQQSTGMLRVDLVPFWLAKVDISRVREEIKPKLKQYQREVVKVLWEAFQEGRLTADPVLDDLLRSDSDAVQAYKMLQALVKLARNQILLEAQLQTHTEHLADHDQRLEDIEATLGDTGRLVTPDQASQISQAVKAVALALGKKSGRNEFGAIYGELYRKFGITGYKQLPASKFQQAMGWLAEWHENLEGPLSF
jgi:ferritin-like metal-binding protein YciE